MNATKRQPHLTAEVHKSGLKVRVCVGKEELTLDAAEMGTLIRELGARRAMLADAVPMELGPNPKLNPMMSPPTVIGDVEIGEKMGRTSFVLMAYRNPAYGWQAMAYTKEAARGIVQGMEKVLLKIDPTRAGSSKLILPGQ